MVSEEGLAEMGVVLASFACHSACGGEVCFVHGVDGTSVRYMEEFLTSYEKTSCGVAKSAKCSILKNLQEKIFRQGTRS